MTSETPSEKAPEPEHTSAPAEPAESPFEPFETEGFQGSDDHGEDALEFSDVPPKRGQPDRGE